MHGKIALYCNPGKTTDTRYDRCMTWEEELCYPHLGNGRIVQKNEMLRAHLFYWERIEEGKKLADNSFKFTFCSPPFSNLNFQ